MPRVLSMFSCSRVLCVNCRLPRSIACFSSLREIQVAHLHHQVKSREALFLRRVIPEIWTRISETGDPRPTKTLRFFLLASFFFVFCFVFCSALWTVRVCLSYQRPQQQPTTVVKTSTSSTSSQRELSYPILFYYYFLPSDNVFGFLSTSFFRRMLYDWSTSTITPHIVGWQKI